MTGDVQPALAMGQESAYAAALSHCGRYRWWLWRGWGDPDNAVHFVMLNPSSADARVDDPTVRRCIGFARDLGYGGLYVTNLFPWRTSDPRQLLAAFEAGEPVLPEGCDEHILRGACRTRRTILAWGHHGKTFHARASAVRNLLDAYGVTTWALRLTKGGQPAHPLYLPAGLEPVRLS